MRKLVALGCAVAALAVPGAIAAERITVFAAASLTDTFPKIAESPRYSFAGSDQLALQIRQGAPADVYAAASPKYAQLLYHDGFVTRPVTFATNRLILLLPRSNPAGIRSVYDTRRAGTKVVIGDPGVPIGAYTRRLLDAIGITGEVLRNVVSQETDVKGIVSKVALGEADVGFVYATDARPVRARTRTVPLPAWAQPSIRYQVVVVKSSPRKSAARGFVRRLTSKRGRLLLRRAGFGLPKRP